IKSKSHQICIDAHSQETSRADDESVLQFRRRVYALASQMGLSMTALLLAPGRLHPFVNLLLPVFGLMCSVALARTPPPSSDHTAALPSFEHVKSQLKGTDAADTIARQVPVSTYLQTYITRIWDARKYNGPFTPGEQKLMGDYAKAA